MNPPARVILSEAKDLILVKLDTDQDEILRRYAPQNDTPFAASDISFCNGFLAATKQIGSPDHGGR